MLPRTLRIVVILVLAGGIIARAVGVASSDDPNDGSHAGMPVFSGGTSTLFFDATFHPGSLRPWWKTDVAGTASKIHSRTSIPQGIAIVRAPGLHGVWAAKFSVSPAAAHVPRLGGPAVERTELEAAPGDTLAWPGRVTWYSWAMYFPRGFQSPAGGHSAIVDQDKRISGRCGPPNLVVAVNNEPGTPGVIRLKTQGGFITDNTNMSLGDTDYCPGLTSQWFSLAPFTPSRWLYVLLRVAWSPNPSVGAITAWVNGCRVVPFTHVATLYSNSGGVYWRQGLYERATPTPESVFQLGMRVGTSFASVTQGSLSRAKPRSCG